VLQLLYLGGRSREIAAALDVTASTVESHKRRIFAKLEVHSWIQAIQRAEDLGLIRGCRPDDAATRPPDRAPPMLTPREREVLALLGAGHTVKQTAHRLGIAEKTVESVQRHLFGKLGVHDRVGALAAVYGRASPPADQDP
jgi:DNA-binding NarL/FixJ family response regulator